MLFSLLVLPYLISRIGITQYGVIVFALAFVAYFKTIVNFSFDVTAVRSISSNQENTNEINRIVSEVLRTRILLLLCTFVPGMIIIYLVPDFNEHLSIFLIVFSTLIGYALYPEWFFIGVEKMEYIAVMMISLKILHVISIFIFISEPSDSWIYAIILSAEQFFLALTGLITMYFKFHIKQTAVPLSKIRKLLKSNISLFLNQLLPNLFNNTATLLLGFFHGATATGTFGIIRKLTRPGKNFLTIVTSVFFPAINRDKENTAKYRTTQWILTVAIIIIICAFAPFLPEIFEGITSSIVIPLFILTSGILGLTLYDIYGHNFFLVKHEDRLVLKNTFIFSILGFIAAFPAIYYGSIIGATAIVAGTQIAIGTRLFILSNKEIKR